MLEVHVLFRQELNLNSEMEKSKTAYITSCAGLSHTLGC